MLVVIDPGHGGADHPGAVARDGSGFTEAEAVLDIGHRVRRELVARGIDCMMTRTEDVHVSLADRCRMANSLDADAFVSIHLNAGAPSNSHSSGCEVWIHENATLRGTVLAHRIKDEIVDVTEERDRGVKRSRVYATLRRTKMPSLVVECGFISCPAEADRYKLPEYRQTVAAAMGRAIASWCHDMDI